MPSATGRSIHAVDTALISALDLDNVAGRTVARSGASGQIGTFPGADAQARYGKDGTSLVVRGAFAHRAVVD